MLLDTSEIEAGAVVRTPSCIVGSGPAGIAIARELATRKLDCLLLESGGFEADGATQDLYAGEVAGPLPLPASYPLTTRLRFFGGTSNHWGGNCRPLDPIDFEKRSWISNSGWPISASDLDSYYARALELCELDPLPWSLAALPGGDRLLELGPGFESRPFQTGPPTRFGQRYREDIVSSPHVRLATGASVLSLEASADGRRVESLRVRGPRSEFRVEAERVVLAAGGIENARLLLLSDSVQRQGLGNQHDLVGRYFADHPDLRKVAELVCWAPVDDFQLYGSRSVYGAMKARSWAVLCPSPALQESRGFRNSAFHLDRVRDRTPGAGFRLDAQDAVIRVSNGLDARHRGARSMATKLNATLFFDPTPNPESRVTLTEERDAHGQRRVRVDWRIVPEDITSAHELIDLLAAEVGRGSRGRVRLETQRGFQHVRWNKHHMGTTRMHGSPRQGVVDANSRVHGFRNLWIAGSSVFPTYGHANPTLTIVALSLRLADHLARQSAASLGSTRTREATP